MCRSERAAALARRFDFFLHVCFFYVYIHVYRNQPAAPAIFLHEYFFTCIFFLASCPQVYYMYIGISQLLQLARRRGRQYDRMIIELSGVAEPKNIRRELHTIYTWRCRAQEHQARGCGSGRGCPQIADQTKIKTSGESLRKRPRLAT